MTVGIIGSGIGGLATAIRLASAGNEVTVFEANAYPGGKLSAFELGEYQFDAGPSLFTMPHFIEELFQLAGKDMQQYFEYVKTDTVCHYFWEDKTTLIAYADVEKFATEAHEKLGVPKKVLKNALKDAKRKYDLTAEVFLHRSLHQIKNYFNTATLRGILAMPTLDMLSSINTVNERLHHPKLTQLFNRFATYNGSNPYKASGIMTSIPHLEHGFGTFFPKGGMNAITLALYQLAKDLGVVFHFNTKIEEIIIENKKATALRTIKTILPFDAVVSNMDIFFTYRQLLPHQKHPEKTLAQPKSSSALIFYWGIKRNFKNLGLHNILFSEDYKTEFDYIFNKKAVFDDPTIYINISSKYEASAAPEGCENWFTMVNVPCDEGQDWDTIIPKVRKNTIEKINRMLNVSLEDWIEAEEILEPRTIESKTWSHKGALYGTSSNNLMAAFLRHPNFSRTIKNLYFCGGSVHPGGGIPLCLLSAKIVSDVIEDI